MAQKNFADAMNQIVNGTNGIKSMINVKADKHSPALTGTPTAPTPDNDTDSGQIATTEFCQNLIRRLVGSAPETLNTLVELATAINNDPDFATTIVQALDKKLNKTDAANTYATKAELDDIDIDTSNLAELNAANTFTKEQEFSGNVVITGNTYLKNPIYIEHDIYSDEITFTKRSSNRYAYGFKFISAVQGANGFFPEIIASNGAAGHSGIFLSYDGVQGNRSVCVGYDNIWIKSPRIDLNGEVYVNGTKIG